MSSPLKHFTNAKKKINNIFTDVAHYIQEFGEFLDDTAKSDENEVVSEELEDEVLAALEKVNGIKDIVSRNHMKVVFFGRTSNGKSTVINAMLWDKILPSGIGHTTSCFLSIAGCNDDKNAFDDSGYLLCGDCDERKSVKTVTQLSHALSEESMSCDNLIQVFWPKRKCALLKDEVVLLDSPGIDVSSDLDRWIDNYCLDADVFILVANAESTLMLAEKKFFHRVNEKLSKPNIFILNNRWDASASEPELMDEVRKQHLERGISFLADELKVITKQQAHDRVFFVSAKETLLSRIQKLQGKPEGTSYMADGHQARLMEFNQFEREFEHCISQSATRTKFEQHCHRAAKLIDSLYNRAQWLHTRASEVMKESDDRKNFLERRLEYIDYQMKLITERCRESISALASEAERQVRVAMTEEIKRLPSLVDEFQRPFHPNPMVLRVYKTELYRHVEDGLGRNLSARCSNALQKEIDKNRGEMIKTIGPLLLPTSSPSSTVSGEAGTESSCVDDQVAQAVPEVSRSTTFFRSLMRSNSQQPSFDMSYDIDCASLCADFQEDIEFKFSLGFQQLIARFIGPKQARRVRLRGITVEPPLPSPATHHPGLPSDHVGIHGTPDPVPTDELLWSLASGYMTFTQGHSSVFVAVMGLLPWVLWRTIGWRAVAFSFASYGAMYVYERVTWTSRAKEKAVKRQFVEHATDKLNLVISFTSSNCSHQVQQELSGTFAHLCSDVESVRQEIHREVDSLTEKGRNLAKVHTRSKTLRNKAGWLASELENFARNYLSPVATDDAATTQRLNA